jgi:hypothetical protein
MGDTVSERVRFAGARASDNQQGSLDVTVRSDTVLDGSALLQIEHFDT